MAGQHRQQQGRHRTDVDGGGCATAVALVFSSLLLVSVLAGWPLAL